MPKYRSPIQKSSTSSNALWPCPSVHPFLLCFFRHLYHVCTLSPQLIPAPRVILYRHDGNVTPCCSHDSDPQARTRALGTFMEQSPSHSRSLPALCPSHFRSFLSSLLASALFFAPCLDAANYAASGPASAKDKKQKQDPVLKGLPITDLNVDEAILHALNRLAYG